MSDPDRFRIPLLKSPTYPAVKGWTREPDGGVTQSDHSLLVKMWFMAMVGCDNEPEPVADLLRQLSPKTHVTTTHGVLAPGVRSTELNPRWSALDRGSSATILTTEPASIGIDADKVPWPEDSALGRVENIEGQAEYTRDEKLPPAFKGARMVVRASSSTGLRDGYGSLHLIGFFRRPVPLATQYRYLKGYQSIGGRVDPAVARPGQPFHSGRPIFNNMPDPVPEPLRVFVLDGFKHTIDDINWGEFEGPLLAREATERRARAVAADLGWAEVLKRHLGNIDGKDRLGFFTPLSIALGRASLSNAPIEEVVGVLRAAVERHPDYSTRRGQYSEDWLRREYRRFRAKDARRDMRIAEIRGQLIQSRDEAP
jgi:hypothetical protein